MARIDAVVVVLLRPPPRVRVIVAEVTGLAQVMPRGSRSVSTMSRVSASRVVTPPTMLMAVVPPVAPPSVPNDFEMPSCGLVGMVKMLALHSIGLSSSPRVIWGMAVEVFRSWFSPPLASASEGSAKPQTVRRSS
ncbi:unannotated protein [freshwater metagenome]|uniref:Unannotated protein n=1 Tax=freshwater metagenome TaxID=449393 RepID=A0A6J5YJ87_9ZZZZ